MLAVGIALFTVANAPADESSPSHKPLPNQNLDLRDPDDLLHRRVGQAEDQKRFNQLAENVLKGVKLENLSKKDLEALAKLAKQREKDGKMPDLSKPEFADLRKKLHEANLDGLMNNLTPADVAALQNLNEQRKKDPKNPKAGVDTSNPAVQELGAKLALEKLQSQVVEQALKNAKVEKLSEKDWAELKDLANQHDKDGKIPDPSDPKVADLRKKLHDANLDGLLNNITNGDVDGLQKLNEQKKKDPKNPNASIDVSDPAVQELGKKLVSEIPINQGDGQKGLADFLKNYPFTGLPDPKAQTPSENPDKGGPTLPPVAQPQPPNSGTNNQQTTALDAAKNLPQQAPATHEPSWLGKIFLKFADKATAGDDESKSWLADKVKNLAVNSSNKASDGPGSGTNWSKLGEYFPADKINDASAAVSKVKLPDVGSGAAGTPNLPGSGSGDSSVGAVNVIIGALLVVLVGVVAWVLLSKLKGGQDAKGGDAWMLGAWPVQPSMVRTRGDIVKAFEYLAVLVLGATARTQHHLELAEELGQQAPTQDARRAEAARALARLYEIARYTPETETLPADDLAAARRELSFLAGAAAA
jgi:hypothetical protein